MVQVDIFWSYGLAAGLTLASKKSLQTYPQIWKHHSLVPILLWFAWAFAPSGIYLLWEFPAWETMFVATHHQSIPSWIVRPLCHDQCTCPPSRLLCNRLSHTKGTALGRSPPTRMGTPSYVLYTLCGARRLRI